MKERLETMARVGYGARGVVYLMVACLAVLAALGAGGQVTGSKGALRTFLSEPLGWVWLGLVGLGLLCFSIWRLVAAFTDACVGTRSESKSPWVRVAYVISAILYLGLAWWAVNLAFGWASGGGDSGPKEWTAWLLGQPFGSWLVMATGTAVSLAGFAFYRRALKDDFSEDLQGQTSESLGLLGKVGYAARGLVFNLIGLFLIIAGLQSDPSKAEGLGGALNSLQQQPYGWILLAVTAAGLGAFGAFNVAQAFYGRVRLAISA